MQYGQGTTQITSSSEIILHSEIDHFINLLELQHFDILTLLSAAYTSGLQYVLAYARALTASQSFAERMLP